MNCFVDNWYLIVAALAAVGCVVGFGVKFFKMTREQQFANIKEWLKWAVTQAEIALGGGTGQLKLRLVYNLAVEKFPWIVKVISFETFSKWVDEALIWLNNQLESNKAIKEMVGE